VSDYQSVKAELDKGTQPDLLCATCPWDRLCITPPSMTQSQINEHIKKAGADDRREKDGGMAAIMTALMFAGKDTSAQVCPVFALRLTGPDGRGIADGVRNQMRDWRPGGES